MADPATRRVVVGAAIIRHGRLLAARRATPEALARRWELPGGKMRAGEDAAAAAVREVREELGCEIEVTGHLEGEQPVREDLVLRVVLAGLVSGEPTPSEHDIVHWVGPEQLDGLAWLAPDLPFLPALRELLLDGERLAGGNLGGAVRIGRTVRRATGPWTPSVHALLDHVAHRGLACAPRVLGTDVRGREVLSYLPGRVVDVDHELMSEGQLVALADWARRMHGCVRDFAATGPWRFWDVEHPELVAHNDLAPYNICFEGDHLVGVFDWDLAGPSTPLMELSHLAWNCVPLFRRIDPGLAARRLEVLASSYAGPSAREILRAVPVRTRVAIDGIRAEIAAGSTDFAILAALGEPERTEACLADLTTRIPSIERELSD